MKQPVGVDEGVVKRKANVAHRASPLCPRLNAIGNASSTSDPKLQDIIVANDLVAEALPLLARAAVDQDGGSNLPGRGDQAVVVLQLLCDPISACPTLDPQHFVHMPKYGLPVLEEHGHIGAEKNSSTTPDLGDQWLQSRAKGLVQRGGEQVA